jgi:hypothetical protein
MPLGYRLYSYVVIGDEKYENCLVFDDKTEWNDVYARLFCCLITKIEISFNNGPRIPSNSIGATSTIASFDLSLDNYEIDFLVFIFSGVSKRNNTNSNHSRRNNSGFGTSTIIGSSTQNSPNTGNSSANFSSTSKRTEFDYCAEIHSSKGGYVKFYFNSLKDFKSNILPLIQRDNYLR